MLLRRAFLAASTAWAAAIPLAAYSASRPDGSSVAYAFALGVYDLGRIVCHQLPARSFHVWMTSLPVCARCTGIYAGAALAALALRGRLVDTRSNPKIVLLAALVPTAATLAFEWTTGVMPSHWIRALAGVPLGVAVAWAIGMVN
jgi:uncharacterized membrane protein